MTHPTTAMIDQAFWTRLYRFVRRISPLDHGAAEDLVQEVFCKLLQRGALERFEAAAESDAHLFALVKTTARRELAKRFRSEAAQKRRGWSDRVSLDDESLDLEPPSTYHDERAYEEVESIAERSEELLEDEFRLLGKEQQFGLLRPALVGGSGRRPDYDSMAEQSGRSAATLRVDLFRARQRYRQIVREQLELAA